MIDNCDLDVCYSNGNGLTICHLTMASSVDDLSMLISNMQLRRL